MSSIAARDRLVASGDDALVRRAGRGDVAAFDVLVASRLDRCYRLAWTILENEADAADATQDAFVAAWRQLPRLRDPHAFDPWLNRIVANAARMARRHRRRLREVSISPIADDASGAEVPEAGTHGTPDAVDEVVQRDAITRAFDRLRPAERQILVMHHVDERQVEEIAATLGIPTGTAKWRLHAARRALERAMEVEA